jgi:hypothetical protein
VSRVAMQRMRTALTRTQPIERSEEMRLALADWLHRRPRRVKLRTDGYGLDRTRPAAVLFAEVPLSAGASPSEPSSSELR